MRVLQHGGRSWLELWRDKPAPRPGHSQLGVGYMGIRIEPQDPPGTYKVVATARDLLSGDSATSVASFEVMPR